MNIDTRQIKNENELTAEEKASGKWRPLTRAERRAERTKAMRQARKFHRAQNRGHVTHGSPPSLLQSLRQAGQIQRARAEVDELLARQESA